MIFASRCFARHYSNRCTVNRGVCFVQLVGTETGDTTPSILLHNQYASYIFNCGENLSRSFQAAKTDLSSLQRVFLTQLTARAIGGLPGLCLTFGSSLAQLDIQGPARITDYWKHVQPLLTVNVDRGCSACKATGLALSGTPTVCKLCEAEVADRLREATSAQKGVPGEQLRVCPHPIFKSLEHCYMDGHLQVTAVVLGHCGFHLSRLLGEDAQPQIPLPPEPLAQAVSYIIHLHPRPGKFDVAKAHALGMREDLRSKLVLGHPTEMTLVQPDGTKVRRMVRPEEVCDPMCCGEAIAVTDCPSLDHLPSLLSEPSYHYYQSSQTSPSFVPFPERDFTFAHMWKAVGKTHQLRYMFHFSPSEVVAHPDYQSWMKSFGDCEHVMINRQHTKPRVVFQSHEQLHNYLRSSSEHMFPPLQADPFKDSRDDPSELAGLRIVEAQHQWKWTYFPLHLQNVEIAPSPPLLSLEDFQMDPKPVPQEEWCTGLAAIEKLSFDPLLVFLGTSSSVPTDIRNVTGIYFNPNPFGYCTGIILDCGEGTYGQLARMYGEIGARKKVQNLGCIWISHDHADHHFGLLRILEVFAEEWVPGAPKLLLIGPASLRGWLSAFAATSQNRKLNRCFTFVAAADIDKSAQVRGWCQARFSGQILNVRANHCADSWSFIFQHSSKFKLVYSGDTEYCEALIQAGQGATVLIHEATFRESSQEAASGKKHSTILDAILTAECMRAERLIVTHFSARHVHPGLPEDDLCSFVNYDAWGRTIPAFDCTEIRFKQLKQLPALRPLLLEGLQKFQRCKMASDSVTLKTGEENRTVS